MRDVLSSWLSGPQSVTEDSSIRYPGSDMRLPQYGRGAIAGSFRRAIALCVDWLASYALCFMVWGRTAALFSEVLTIWFCICWLSVTLINCTPGQILTGITIVRVDSSGCARIGFLRAFVRQILLVPMLIPAFFLDYNGRGMHDRATGTAVIRS